MLQKKNEHARRTYRPADRSTVLLSKAKERMHVQLNLLGSLLFEVAARLGADGTPAGCGPWLSWVVRLGLGSRRLVGWVGRHKRAVGGRVRERTKIERSSYDASCRARVTLASGVGCFQRY